ncbi:MAG: aldose 1-epimerase [Firmicutes bacterium]|nr:aldose 1-epimerase [Bacillota bacterium]
MKGYRYLIRETFFGSEKAYELVDGAAGLEATLIPGFGSNLISLRNTRKGIDFIKGPGTMAQLRERPVGSGFPVLMPPSRIANGTFEFMGRRYTFERNEGGKNHIHGLVCNRPWRITRACAGDDGVFVQTRISSDDHPEILRSLPHSFELELSFQLKDGALTIDVAATNRGPDPMPFGLGFHPYFKVPLADDSSKASCFIKLPASKRWELVDLLPTGKILPVEGKYDLRAGRGLEGLVLDDVFTEVEAEPGPHLHGNMVKCEYRDEMAGAGIIFEAGVEFPHWVVYTGRTTDTNFICLEPYTWIPNAPNVNLPAELTGARALMPSEPFKGRMVLTPYC